MKSAARLAELPAVLLERVPAEEIPDAEDILSGPALEARLAALTELPYSFVAGGDVMLAGRARKSIRLHGPDYPLDGVLPLLKRAPVALANLEGPFAKAEKRDERNYAYRVSPKFAAVLKKAGVNVLTLANNHLVDCGRRGVRETLDALREAGIEAIGAGLDTEGAHRPAVLECGRFKVGFLGYYWNRRTAATERHAGSAMDPPDALRDDIAALRARVNRVVVTFHWGVPYEREPSADDRAKARLAIDLGADVVIGHHPHVVQAFEIHRDRPIFYSVGNFAFGSGNSRAEGLLLGVRFEEENTLVHVHPIYVKNRDPRVDYQPKVLRGSAGTRILALLAELSGPAGAKLAMTDGLGTLLLPREGTHG